MIVKLFLGGFLAAHAAIHAGFVSRPPATAGGPPWPFDLGRSWLLEPLGVGAAWPRVLGMGLVLVVLGAYGVAVLSVLGLLPESLFGPSVIVGSVASLVLLGLYFHPWLVIGVAVDAVLIWLIAGGWAPDALGT